MNQKTKSGSSINSTYKIFLLLTSSLLVMSKAEGFSILENLLAITGQSLDAYEKCVERQSDSVSKDAQKMFCKTKYEQKYSRTDVDIEGRGSYQGSGESTYFRATITNNSSDLIITRIELIIYNDDNKSRSETCESGKSSLNYPLWIEPNGDSDAVSCDVKFIPDKDRRVHKNKGGTWSWNIKTFYGLKLD